MSCSIIINLPVPQLPQSLPSWIYPDLLMQKLKDHTYLNFYFPPRKKENVKLLSVTWILST